jgi:hypothetical protein
MSPHLLLLSTMLRVADHNQADWLHFVLNEVTIN